MNPTLVTATEESSGKTAVALALALEARSRGLSVGYMKPKGTRLQTRTGKVLDEDPLLARSLLDLDDDVADMEPIVYSPTFVEGALRHRENPDDLRETVREKFDALADGRDLMIVEGSGSLGTGEVVGLTDADVAELLDARVIVVVDYESIADVDDVLAVTRRIGDRVDGVVFNRVPDAAVDDIEADVVPFLEGEGVPVLGVIPWDTDLAGITVADLAAELGAETLTDVPADAYVERLLVGAMSGESALRHFRRTRDAAVVTGGDRSEIQTVALEAPGVKCLVLTGGVGPSGAVLGLAEERGVPVLLVRTDTLRTIERMEDVIAGGRTRDEPAVLRMRELLTEHADVDALLDQE